MSGADWESLGSIVPVVLWLLFLLLRKRARQGNVASTHDEEEQLPPLEHERLRRSGRRRHDETGGFERHYDPIEPS